jgi:hypothetical protein
MAKKLKKILRIKKKCNFWKKLALKQLKTNIWLNFFYKKKIVLNSKQVLLTLSLYICAFKKVILTDGLNLSKSQTKKLTFL